jgi:hypothetical protein
MSLPFRGNVCRLDNHYFVPVAGSDLRPGEAVIVLRAAEYDEEQTLIEEVKAFLSHEEGRQEDVRQVRAIAGHFKKESETP